MAGHGKFFVGGNWKCNGDKHGVKKLIDDLNAADVPEDIDIIVAPTFIHLEQVQGALKKPYQLGAQNCWVGKGGAFTGEISAEQLHDIGVPWVIVGHSERRLFMDETNDFVGHKAAYALSQDLSVIACIGETLHERQAGQLEEVLTKQLTAIGDNIAGTVHNACKSLHCCDSHGMKWPTYGVVLDVLAMLDMTHLDTMRHAVRRLGQCGHCL